jgi:hypothetical protein
MSTARTVSLIALVLAMSLVPAKVAPAMLSVSIQSHVLIRGATT